MRNELQFGDVLSFPIISEHLEEMIAATLYDADEDALPLMNQISSYSEEVVKRSIHACGVGIALGLFSQYDKEDIRAIGLGCLLHEYGYLINPREHTSYGSRNLEMSFFKKMNRSSSISLDIIQQHHKRIPHKSAQVNSGRIAIHWCSTGTTNNETNIKNIRSRHSFYCKEVNENFIKLYEIMSKRQHN